MNIRPSAWRAVNALLGVSLAAAALLLLRTALRPAPEPDLPAVSSAPRAQGSHTGALALFASPAGPRPAADATAAQPSLAARYRLCGVCARGEAGGWIVLEETGTARQIIVASGETVEGWTVGSVSASGAQIFPAGNPAASQTLALPQAGPASAAARPAQAASPTAPPSADPGVREIDRATILSAAQTLPSVLSSARIVPFYRRGLQAGFLFLDIREHSLFETLGLHDGDIVTHVNGRQLNRPLSREDLEGLLGGQAQPVVRILVDRNSSTVSLTCRIR